MSTALLSVVEPVDAPSAIEDDLRAHGLRVGELAARIAAALGLSPEACNRLAAAAVSHDFGKTSIPPEILLWPGPLAAEWLEVVRGHTVAGERLARRFPGEYGLVAAAIARSHHERFDGAGYPDGLAGDAIPLAVSIVTVADVYDALTSDRAYRRAFSPGAAVAMMKRERGGQFAPHVLDAFLETIGAYVREPRPRLELAQPEAPAVPPTAFRYRAARQAPAR